ncbi:MAG: DNA mismatch repair endonuclease MutL [Bacteroidales bacterium]|nr:DNA mismatch repair endonuclease MutL [Bacteroidales bacterium]
MIRVLPANIANLIAAGEVVGRPAAAVKEMMENSIDAGASQVQVFITDAGRTLIQVIDNGCGMGPEDAVLCFERHATSKIAEAADLEKILTYGFRGEALASIAAVAQVTLRTRREQDETGVRVEVADSKVIDTEAAATPKGCNIEVRNLFYNVPARRKFLKSDAAEMRHITSEFIRVALVNPSIALSLTHNGKNIYTLKAANEKQRIAELFGRDLTNSLVDLSTDSTVLKIRGYIGTPQDARKTLGNQYFFVNGRYFRSPLLHKAVCKPYENLIAADHTPSYFIYLETDPERVDVNIHPAKTEVKFEDESMIFEIIRASVREALGKNAFVPSIDFESGEVLDFGSASREASFPQKGAEFPSYNSKKTDYSPLFKPFEGETFHSAPAYEVGNSFRGDYQPQTRPEANYGVLFEKEMLTPARLLILHNRYILYPCSEGVAVVNIGRAREKVLYERYLPLLAERQQVTQQSLYPMTMTLNPEAHNALMENLDTLTGMGFDLRDFGDNAIVIYGVPAGFSCDEASVGEAVDILASAFLEGGYNIDNQTYLASAMAHSAALGAKKEINQAEAGQLIEELAAFPSATLPDGKSCVSIISNEELEKMFKLK